MRDLESVFSRFLGQGSGPPQSGELLHPREKQNFQGPSFWGNPFVSFRGGYSFTPPKFNIAPEKWWLEDYFPVGKVTFQGRAVKLREGSSPNSVFNTWGSYGSGKRPGG